MKLESVKKVFQGNYITYYIAKYLTKNNHIKEYEFISRDKNLDKDLNFFKTTDAVAIIAFNKSKDKILLLKEFRMPCNDYVYNLPAGLVEKGENITDAVKRELKEETGLNLLSIIDILPPAVTAVGVSNELLSTVIAVVDGTVSESTSEFEEIETQMFSKEEIMELINQGKLMSLRAQSLCYMWAMSENHSF